MFVLIAGGDKVTPGMVMGTLRAEVPAVCVYTGTTELGRFKGRAISWETVFEAIGERRRGALTDADVEGIVAAQMPGPGGGASAYTGNTMGMVAEALGLAMPRSSTVVAGSSEQLRLAWGAGAAIVEAIDAGVAINDSTTPMPAACTNSAACSTGTVNRPTAAMPLMISRSIASASSRDSRLRASPYISR